MLSDNDIIASLLLHKSEGTLRPDDIISQSDTKPLALSDISQAEERLGFDLPPLLRRVYTEVANGGFGESYGFLGLVGGPLNEDEQDAVALYLELRQPDPNDSHWGWPEGLLPLGQLGCGMYHCVQCGDPDSPIVWFEPNPHVAGYPWDDSFLAFCPSLRGYLFAWLDGTDLWETLADDV